MKVNLPNSNRKLVQYNNNETLADSNLVRTWNIDNTTEPGSVRVAPRFYINTDSSDDADLGVPVAFAYNSDSNIYYAVCGTAVFKTSSTDPSATFTEDTSSGNPTTTQRYSDMVMFNGDLYVTTATNVAKLSSGTWDDDWWTVAKGQSALKSNRPHPMDVVQIGSPLFCIGDGNLLHTVTVGDIVSSPRLTLDVNQVIVWIRSGTSKVYIGCMSVSGNDAYVYEWDGGDTVPTYAYNTRTAGAIAGAVIDDTLYIVNSNGELQVLSGGGFKTLNKFPIARSQAVIDNSSFIYSNRRFIHPNGLITYKDNLLALVAIQEDYSGSSFNTVDENTPAGIWEFNTKDQTLSHKYSLTADDSGAVDYGQMAMPCEISADNRAPGALFETTADKYATALLAGAAIYTDDATTFKTAIYNLDNGRTLPARGSVIYPKIFTDNTDESFAELVVKFEPMKSASDKIVLKWRTEVDAELPLVCAATWTNATTFTTTNAGFANVEVGNEIEIIMGNGSGTTAHVTSISEASGTYTVVVDESVSGISASDENYIRANNWRKLDSFNSQTLGSKVITIPTKSFTWLQVKMELRSTSGESPVVERLQIRSKANRQ